MSTSKLYSPDATGLEAAKTAANAKNAEPLKEGKEQRNPYKVYGITVAQTLKGYAVGQTPTAALSPVTCDIGISVDRVDNENLMPVNSYLAKLSPEELAVARDMIAKLTAGPA